MTSLGHELSDAEPRLIGSLAAGVAVFLVLAPLLLMQLYPGAFWHELPRRPETAFAAPRLEIDNASELIELRRSNDERLSTRGWIDRKEQIVRLPIDRAISLTIERGLPGWPKP